MVYLICSVSKGIPGGREDQRLPLQQLWKPEARSPAQGGCTLLGQPLNLAYHKELESEAGFISPLGLSW